MKSFTFAILLLSILSCQRKMAAIKLNGKCGLIDSKGKTVVEPQWDYIDYPWSQLYPVEKDSLWGYIDRQGKVIIKPQYSDANPFFERLANVSNKQGKYGFINLKGDTIIDFKYDWTIGGFSENGLADVVINDSCGYINLEGEIVIPLIYKKCYPFSSFSSNRSKVWSFDNPDPIWINQKGEAIEYSEKQVHLEIQSENGYGRMNLKGDTIVPANYLKIRNFFGGMYSVKNKNEKWGAYNKKGILVIEPHFDELWNFHNGTAMFKLNNKWGIVDRTGEIIVEPIYDYIEPFWSGLAYVEIKGKAGFVNKKGEVAIPLIYEPYRHTLFE